MHKVSLKYKLSVFLILLTLLPALVTGIFSYRILRSSLLNNTRKNELSMLENQMINFDLAMLSFETVLNDLVTSESTQGFLQFRHEKDSEYYYMQLLLLSSKVDSILSQRGDAVKRLAFLWNDGDLPLFRGNIYGIDLSGDYRKKKPFTLLPQTDASIQWQVLEEKDEAVIYCCRTIYESSAKESSGVALLNFSTHYFKELLTRNMEKEAFCVLLDEEGSLVYTEGTGTPDQDLLKDVLRKEEKKGIKWEKRDVRTLNIAGKEYMTSYGRSAVNGWQYYYFNPLTNINEAVHAIAWLVPAVMMASGILSVTAALWLYYYLNLPISSLSRAMIQLKKGNLDTRVRIHRKDEFGLLGDGFNEMAERIKQLIQNIEKEQALKRQAEIQFLQAQITPHFLYNTLNSIKSLARLKRTDDAADMTTALISLLRLSSGGNELISLSKEIEYLKSYTAIMSYRKSRKFHLEVLLESGTGEYRLPKFSLQPFVENSIIHGFSGLEKKGLRIKISASLAMEGLYITVEDNGKGFEIDCVSEKEEENGIRFSHIGMKNVEERIRLYFGKQYGIKVESVPDEGTRVTLFLPKERQDMRKQDTESKNKAIVK